MEQRVGSSPVVLCQVHHEVAFQQPSHRCLRTKPSQSQSHSPEGLRLWMRSDRSPSVLSSPTKAAPGSAREEAAPGPERAVQRYDLGPNRGRGYLFCPDDLSQQPPLQERPRPSWHLPRWTTLACYRSIHADRGSMTEGDLQSDWALGGLGHIRVRDSRETRGQQLQDELNFCKRTSRYIPLDWRIGLASTT